MISLFCPIANTISTRCFVQTLVYIVLIDSGY